MKKVKKLLGVAILGMLSFATICLSAACGDKKAVYTFVSDGATYETQKIEAGAECPLPTPTKEGYEFLGWYTTENFEGEKVTSIVATPEGGTYYAKWEKLCVITLTNADSLGTNKLYLKTGANVSQFMKDYVPQKTDMQFGGWFVDGKEISSNLKITEAGLTLEARYKVKYEVKYYLESLENPGTYDEATDKTVVGYEYAGVEMEAKSSVKGFVDSKNEGLGSVTKLTLAEDASKNVFKRYMDRESYTVRFRSNFPVEGVEEEIVTVEKKYEETITVPYELETRGYCLIGWSTRLNGEVEYKADYIGSVLYGNEEDNKSAEMQVLGDQVLYAVWAKGITDFFGNSEDFLYLLDEDSDVIYLSRGGIYFQGEYYDSDRAFYFLLNDAPIIEGFLHDNGTYVYYDSSRKLTLSLFEFGVGVNTNVRVMFDAYNGIDYEVKAENGTTTTSKGTYSIDENGYYYANFTEGALAGQEMVFVVGQTTVSGTSVDVFQVRQDDEIALGTLPHFVVSGGALSYSTSIVLGGFGIANYTDGSSADYYYYLYDEDAQTITLINTSSGKTVALMKIVEENGVRGVAQYNSAADREFPIASGAKLVCDGTYNATYTDGTKTMTGYYTMSSSKFGTVATLYVGEETYKYMITATTETVPDESEGAEEGATVQQTVYSAVEIYNGYAEYSFRNDAGKTEDAPLMVIDGEDSNGNYTATIYGYNKTTKTYVKVSAGEFVYNEELKKYVYTAKEIVADADVSTDYMDVKDVQSFVCDLGAVSGSSGTVAVYFWYSSTNGEGIVTPYDAVYTQKDGEAKLTLVAGVAIYSVAEGSLMGAYTVKEYNGVEVLVISTSAGYIYLELEGETFILYSTAPYQAYVLQEDGTANKYEYVIFNGKGGATYVVITVDADGNEISRKEYVGTFEEANKTSEFATNIYVFSGKTADGEEISFEYLALASSSTNLVAPYNEQYNGEYSSEDGTYLTLDGFGFKASYWVEGEAIEGIYWIGEENTVVFSTEERNYIFDLTGRTFTLRGEEYGVYLIRENWEYRDEAFLFDGYGKVTVSIPDETADEGVAEVEGSYEKRGDYYVVTYTFRSTTYELTGILQPYSSSVSVFTIVHEEVVKTYLNEADWSLLILDNAGGAIKYQKNGLQESGAFKLITNDLLYYVNGAGTDAMLYKYGVNADGLAVATPIVMTARGYFSSDLQSLLFSKYGYVLLNGELEYYYEIVNSQVQLYYYEPENDNANDYGYVIKQFGQFDEAVKLDGVDYYANDGVMIKFNRAEETKNDYAAVLKTNDATKYPLQALSFTPVFDTEYTVMGYVKIDGKDGETAYVQRTLQEDGTILLQFVYGTYIYDISVNYTGDNDNSIYEVVGMRSVVTCYSYTYLYIYQILASFGIPVQNTYGLIQMHTEYDAAGNEVESYLLGAFGENSDMYDLNGELVTIDETSVLTENADGTYVAEFVAGDGHTYRFYFVVSYYQAFGVYSYNVYAFTREEVLKTEDEKYEVTLDVVVATEHSLVTVGNVFAATIKMGDAIIEGSECVYVGGELYYVVRTTGDNASVTYYKISLTKNEVIEGAPATVTYKSVAVSVIDTVTTIYSEDKAIYADVMDGKVAVFYYEGELYCAVSCEYDAASGVYTIETTTGETYKITVTENVIVSVEKVEETQEDGSLEEAA